MLDPVAGSTKDLVLPALEAACMVTAVKDAEPDSLQNRPLRSSLQVTIPLRSPPKRTTNSAWRAGRILSCVIPPLLGLFILNGWLFANHFIIPYVCNTQSTVICKSYTATFHSLLILTSGLFLFLWLVPSHHSSPPSALPPAIRDQLIPHQVISSEGDYSECWQDNCEGRILPPRARHCKDCRKCRLDFDHHCPWVGCIARDTMKAFILFLGLAALAIIVGLLPVYRLAWTQCIHVTSLIWDEEWMYEEWWNSSWSWAGGPLSRYVGAVAIAYLYYEPTSDSRLYEVSNAGNAPVSMTLLFYIFYGTILGIFCVVMFTTSLQDVMKASSTIEATRTSKRRKSSGTKSYTSYRLIKMPSVKSNLLQVGEARPGDIQEIDASVELYNFGICGNLKRVFGYTVKDWISPWPPIADPAEHWHLGPKALAYVEMPSDQKETNRKCE